MKLTEELKTEIDSKTYVQLLQMWRFSPISAPLFQGESADYIAKKMVEMRAEPGGEDRHVAASKLIGWEA